MKAFLSIVQMASTACGFLLQLTKIRAVENAEVEEYKAEYVSDADGHWFGCKRQSDEASRYDLIIQFLPRCTMLREIDGLRLLLVLVKQAIALCTISKRITDMLISSYHTTLSMHTLNAFFARIQTCFYRAQESVANSASGPQLHISPTHVPSQLSTCFDG
ncbi:hypothetical protein T02_5474 [Trichinella nativa]|uniref:Secreted protein n=1 Tax=Trichinella nativa TaxID=6335 RepID=A0A0V1LED9_9BILA|nr:hypothetical protein T02_5474 [Trichinella nativa]